ncbi:MAG: hypothetical protein ACLPOA_09820 [Methylocella sp.]
MGWPGGFAGCNGGGAGLVAPSGRPPKEIGSIPDPISDDKPITLADAGIDKHLADKARKFADRTEDEFETFLAKAVQKVSDGIEGRKANRTSFTADNEWFTPPEYLELARTAPVSACATCHDLAISHVLAYEPHALFCRR